MSIVSARRVAEGVMHKTDHNTLSPKLEQSFDWTTFNFTDSELNKVLGSEFLRFVNGKKNDKNEKDFIKNIRAFAGKSLTIHYDLLALKQISKGVFGVKDLPAGEWDRIKSDIKVAFQTARGLYQQLSARNLVIGFSSVADYDQLSNASSSKKLISKQITSALDGPSLRDYIHNGYKFHHDKTTGNNRLTAPNGRDATNILGDIAQRKVDTLARFSYLSEDVALANSVNKNR